MHVIIAVMRWYDAGHHRLVLFEQAKPEDPIAGSSVKNRAQPVLRFSIAIQHHFQPVTEFAKISIQPDRADVM